MTRFILITFLFLGFAFYEMSGGSEFDAEATRLSRVDPGPETAAPAKVAVASPAPSVAALPENVSRIKLDLTSVEDVLRPGQRRAEPVVAATSVAAAVETAAKIEVLPSLLIDQAVIKPVDFGAEPEPVVTNAVPNQVRQVTGSAVNVRGGPGTEYSVVNRLVRGDEVEVLQDPGNGWIQLRPVDGGPVGWMAAFLLSQG
ncbi:MAG: SH3 domain-containing protein [Pseudomonadota bacterium]